MLLLFFCILWLLLLILWWLKNRERTHTHTVSIECERDRQEWRETNIMYIKTIFVRSSVQPLSVCDVWMKNSHKMKRRKKATTIANGSRTKKKRCELQKNTSYSDTKFLIHSTIGFDCIWVYSIRRCPHMLIYPLSRNRSVRRILCMFRNFAFFFQRLLFFSAFVRPSLCVLILFAIAAPFFRLTWASNTINIYVFVYICSV